MLPPPPLRLLPGGAIQFPGESFFSLWTSAFSRRTVIAMLRHVTRKEKLCEVRMLSHSSTSSRRALYGTTLLWPTCLLSLPT